METQVQCNDCLTIFTGIGDLECPKCEGTMHEIHYSKKENTMEEERLNAILADLKRGAISFDLAKYNAINWCIQSQITLLQEIKEEVESKLVNTPEQVAELNKDLPNILQEQSYLEAIGYTKAIKDTLQSLSSRIARLQELKK